MTHPTEAEHTCDGAFSDHVCPACVGEETEPTEAGERASPFQIVKRVVRDEAFRLQRLHAAGDTENERTAIPRIAKKIVEALHAANLLRTEPSGEAVAWALWVTSDDGLRWLAEVVHRDDVTISGKIPDVRIEYWRMDGKVEAEPLYLRPTAPVEDA